MPRGLATARGRRRLVVVFGCGGDRDPGKRPLMGEIAAELADDIVITDDNPRTESREAITRELAATRRPVPPEAITREVAALIPPGRPYRNGPARGRGIRSAVIDADADDVVV